MLTKLQPRFFQASASLALINSPMYTSAVMCCPVPTVHTAVQCTLESCIAGHDLRNTEHMGFLWTLFTIQIDSKSGLNWRHFFKYQIVQEWHFALNILSFKFFSIICLPKRKTFGNIMILRLDDNSEVGAHVRSNFCYWPCLIHLVRLSQKSEFFS